VHFYYTDQKRPAAIWHCLARPDAFAKVEEHARHAAVERKRTGQTDAPNTRGPLPRLEES
jgi:hypothetical protein